jgi:hypothetical protein
MKNQKIQTITHYGEIKKFIIIFNHLIIIFFFSFLYIYLRYIYKYTIMGKYLGKTKHKKVKKYNNISRRIQRGGTLTSQKINYIMDIIKKYSKRDLGGIKGIVSIDSKKNKVAASITDENIKKVLTMIQTMKPQEITEHIEKLRTEENPISLTRANTELEVGSRHTGVPFRFGDPTIPDVGSTEDYGAHRRPAGRVRHGSPRRLPSSFAFDTTESVKGPWALSVKDSSHILPSPRPGVRRVGRPSALPLRQPLPPFNESFLDDFTSTESVPPPPPPYTESLFRTTDSVSEPRQPLRGPVRQPDPAPYSHDASVSAVSSPRRHGRAAVSSPRIHDRAVRPPAPEVHNSMEFLMRPEFVSRVNALRNRPGVIPRADFIDVPSHLGVRGKSARAASPSSAPQILSPMAMGSVPEFHAVNTEILASPIALGTIPDLPRSMHESRRGALAPPVSANVSQLSPRASIDSMTSQLSIPDRRTGAPQHSELDMVRYETGDLDRSSSVAPLPRSHSQPSSALNLMNSSQQDQFPWERPGAAFIPEIPPPKSASAAKLPSPSASAAAAKLPSPSASAASPKSGLSTEAKKKEQKRAWALGLFDSTAEQVARPDTEDFDITKSVQNSPQASTANAKPSMFGSDNDFSSLFSTPKQHEGHAMYAGPAMFARPQSDEGLLKTELEEAEQRIIDEEKRDLKIQQASRALKAKGAILLGQKEEQRKEKKRTEAVLKQQRRDDKEARNRQYAARIEELTQMPTRTPEQQMELNRLKLSYDDDDDDDDDSSGGGRRRTKRIKKRGRRSYKIKKSRKNKRNIRSKRSGRK